MRIKIGEMFAALVVIHFGFIMLMVVESFRCGATSASFGRFVFSGIDECVNIHPIATVASLIVLLIVSIFVIIILFEIGKKEIKMGE